MILAKVVFKHVCIIFLKWGARRRVKAIPKCTTQPGLVLTEAMTHKIHSNSLLGGNNLETWVIMCSFWSTFNRKLDWNLGISRNQPRNSCAEQASQYSSLLAPKSISIDIPLCGTPTQPLLVNSWRLRDPCLCLLVNFPQIIIILQAVWLSM